ncbi:MAG: sporulation protein [Pontibacterium sp.]
MLKNLFARIGIGAAVVDAVLTTEHFIPGGPVEGRIDIKGGDVEQDISKITLKLMTKLKVENDEGSSFEDHVINAFIVTDAFCLQPNEERAIPFRFTLHPETPVTALEVANNQSKVWLETALDIDFAADPTDRDYMNIHPTAVMMHCIKAMTNNGFVMAKADVEKGGLNGPGFASSLGFYQELEFKPEGFGFTKEVEFSFVAEQNQTHLLVELDRRFSGDGYRALTFSNQAGYAEVESQLRSLIN